MARDRVSATASRTRLRATAAGMGPYPSTTAGARSPANSISSESTRLTATGWAASAGCPVTRSTNVSAITWPRVRSSNVVSAARLSAA
ncbi:Uncharacterised protein [Mycobacterium tuberculosis]|nr:Uncharacterised protein [Mycobacterium tuberculosis]